MMDFSEIGVKSRKTGITVRQNVRRDEHNMEDLDEFFQDDERTLVTKEEPRIVFHEPTQREELSRRPLRSPLGASSGTKILNGDLHDDPLEHQPGSSMDVDMDMDIDDQSRGSIQLMNDSLTQPTQQPLDDDVPTQADDFDVSFGVDEIRDSPKPVIRRDPRLNTPVGQKLFVSSDEDSPDKSYSQRQRELERNTTVRSESKRSRSGQRTPGTGSRSPTLTPTRYISPVKSISHLHSPLNPTRKTKSIATNDKGRINRRNSFREYDEGDDESDFEDKAVDSSDYSDSQPVKTTRSKKVKKHVDDDDDDDDGGGDDERLQPKKRSARTQKKRINDTDDEIVRSRRGRSRKKVFRSPEPLQHNGEIHIDVETLRLEKESRSSSKHPQAAGLRRSSRVSVPRLAYWRNERQTFVKHAGEQLPSLAEVIRVDEPVQESRSRAPSRRSTSIRARSRARSKSRSRTSRDPSRHGSRATSLSRGVSSEDEEELAVGNGEYSGSEWIRQGFLKIDTFEGHGSDAKSNRLIAWAPGTEAYSTSVVNATDHFKLAILFDKNREFIASGMMSIPPGGSKSLKSTDTTYFVFYCISGILEVTLSGSLFLIKKGCSLEVPMGNFYQFENKGKKDATLFFVQTRGQPED